MNQPWGRGERRINSIEMLKETPPIIGTGEWNNIQCLHFKGENGGLKIGDIILVREGAKTLALCKIISDYFTNSDFEQKYLHINYRNVKILEYAKDMSNFPQPQKTLQILYKQGNSTSWNYINNWYKRIKKEENMNKSKDLLFKRKNLILTGAPGVGKTYKTAEIAVAIADNTFMDFENRSAVMTRYKELQASGQIAFTTFHQSLDYEEFVEGLKPSCDDEETVKYRMGNGILKKTCMRALETESMLSLDAAIDKLKEVCSDGKTVTAKTVTKAKFTISYNDGNSFYITPENSKAITEENKRIPVNIESIKKIYELSTQYDIYNHPYSIQKDYPNIHDPGYAVGILNYLIEIYEMSDYSIDKSGKNYILIIDEINRGNISKIFGELITLLEKDKRLGEENEITVTLPYSQDKFGVPSNLYIIGTMNTADRSIGAIDYALRRRFAFVSLKSDKNVLSNYDKYQDDTKIKAENLFDNVKTFIESNINEDLDADDLMVGHSYFLCETEDDLKRRLEYEIIPLLWEYQKDGILTCDRKTLKDKTEKWLIFDFSSSTTKAVETESNSEPNVGTNNDNE